MRKQDLKVGEEYAAGSSSRGDRWRMSRVRVVELDGERKRSNGTTQSGIVVALVTDSAPFAWPRWLSGKAGDERVIQSARDIQMPWTTYEQAKAEFDERQSAMEAERQRVRKVGGDVMARMVALGGLPGVKFSNGSFTVPADKMAAIIARIPDGHDAG